MTGTTPAAWNDPGRGAELAKGQFDRGVDVVYAAAGATGIGVLQAAKDRGKLAIGVDSNQNYLHPGTILTSMLKRVDVAAYNSFKAAQGGTWKAGIAVLGLKEGGVDWALDQYNEKLITPEMKAKVDAAKADIISGKINVARLHEQQRLQVTVDAGDGSRRRSSSRASTSRSAACTPCAACRWRIEKGAITGIIGENGAGKSTLMSILYGLYRGRRRRDPRRRQPVAHGQPARRASPHGIGMVHQHFMLVDTFTVLENLVLGAEGGPLLATEPRGGARRAGAARRATTGSRVDPDAQVADLSVGEQQRVEILKVLFRGARILILDEPSAVLTPQETDQLFRILRDAEGARRHRRADHPQAARDHGGDRPGLCHAPGPDGGRAPHRRDRRRGAGRADGRPQGAAASSTRRAPQPGEVLLEAEHLGLVDARGVAPARRYRAGAAGRRDRRHRRRLGQRPDRAAAGAGRHPAADRAARLTVCGRADRSPAIPAIRPRCATSAWRTCRRTACARAWWRRSRPPRPRSSAITS